MATDFADVFDLVLSATRIQIHHGDTEPRNSLTSTDQLVLLMLLRNRDSQPSQALMASMSGLCFKSINRSIQRLKKHGLIAVASSGGGIANAYTVQLMRHRDCDYTYVKDNTTRRSALHNRAVK